MSLLILFDGGGGGPPGIPINVTDINVLSRRLVHIVFDDEVIVNDAYNDPDNYAISVVEGVGPIEVARVLPINTAASLDIILVTQPMTLGTTYQVTGGDFQTRNGVDFSIQGNYVSRDTKIDSALRSIPKHFDKRPESLISSL